MIQLRYGNQRGTPLYTCRNVLLIFLVAFCFCVHDSSPSSEVPRCESSSDSNKYIVKYYFEKYENFVESKFQDFILDELPSYSGKHLPDDMHGLLRLLVPNRRLIGEGSHRHLYSNIRIHFQSELESQLPSHNCKVVIIEKLPVGVFADPFELQHLLQRGVFADIAVFGDANLELPSVASNQTIVEIHRNISYNIFSEQTNELEVSTDLPLHARYPPVGESGFAKIEFGRPDLLIQCSQEGNSNNQGFLITQINDHAVLKTDAIEWMMPSGRRSHAGMVSVVTFVAAFMSALVIVVTSVFYSDGSSCKNC